MRFDRKSFFDKYRTAFGSLKPKDVEGLEFLLGAIESDPGWKRIEEIAYVLATTKHETANTFQPIQEYRAKAGSKLRTTQDRYWLSGFYGRGYVMITWEKNYRKFGIADHPEKALEPETAYRILSEGMRDGSFTGKKLSDFINDSEVDYLHARKIVNGLDRASLIAGYAEEFEHILRSSQIKDSRAEEASVTPTVTEKKEASVEPPIEPKKTPTSEVKLEQLEKQGASVSTKVAAAAGPVVTAATALGIKIGNVQLSETTIIAFCVLAAIAIIAGAWLYNEGQKRGHNRQNLLIEKAASQTENTVRIT